MSYTDPPTLFQKKVCWSGLTALAAFVFVAVILIAGWSVISVCGYLKPVLTPIAIAAVLAYLLTPVVAFLCKWKLPRTWAVIVVFILFIIGITLIGVTVTPSLEHQGSAFASRIPAYSQKIGLLAKESAEQIQHLAALRATSPIRSSPLEELTPDNLKLYGIELANNALAWVQEKLPTIASATGTFLQKSIGGVFGLLGFLLSLILVPIFLFFFLGIYIFSL